MADWKPGASVDTLRARAGLLAKIREFFAARDVLEVETPLLAATTATDVYIQSLQVRSSTQDKKPPLYLQTSPEFFMKRLLCAGAGSIYQIGKAFRENESGSRHNPEFTMLEWYRPGFSLSELMDEVEQLVERILGCGIVPRFSYRELFAEHLHINPHQISATELEQLARSVMELNATGLSETDHLQLLMSRCIEPRMPEYCFVYDYPVAQAALARIADDDNGQAVARRFELYCRGMELANGYHELTDADEQRARFEADLLKRRELGLAEYPIDEQLLAALTRGLPECAGVALGIDRLLMLQCEIRDIRQVISFATPTH